MPELNGIIAPSIDDIVAKQAEAVRRAFSEAPDITGVSPENAFVREMLPTDDLGSGSGNTWTETNQEWLQSGLSADQENDVYDITSTDEAQNKVYVFYGLVSLASDQKTTEVLFKDATAATFAQFNIQHLDLTDVPDVFLFDDLIVYGPTENGTLTQWANQAGNDQVQYLAKVGEKQGNTLTVTEQTPVSAARQVA